MDKTNILIFKLNNIKYDFLEGGKLSTDSMEQLDGYISLASLWIWNSLQCVHCSQCEESAPLVWSPQTGCWIPKCWMHYRWYPFWLRYGSGVQIVATNYCFLKTASVWLEIIYSLFLIYFIIFTGLKQPILAKWLNWSTLCAWCLAGRKEWRSLVCIYSGRCMIDAFFSNLELFFRL